MLPSAISVRGPCTELCAFIAGLWKLQARAIDTAGNRELLFASAYVLQTGDVNRVRSPIPFLTSGVSLLFLIAAGSAPALLLLPAPGVRRADSGAALAHQHHGGRLRVCARCRHLLKFPGSSRPAVQAGRDGGQWSGTRNSAGFGGLLRAKVWSCQRSKVAWEGTAGLESP